MDDNHTTSSPDARTEGLALPLPPRALGRLRRLVYDHALTERRRIHLPILHAGIPGERELVFPDLPGEDLDHGLRADVVAALVCRSRRATRKGVRGEEDGDPGAPWLWLTRPGPLDVQDVDARWLAAARQAYGEAGLPLVFVTVNRHGWRDPRSGLGRTWVRMRRRSPGH